MQKTARYSCGEKRLTSNSTSNPNNEASVIKIRPAEQSQWMFCFSLQDMVRCKLGVNVGPAGKTKVAKNIRTSKSHTKKRIVKTITLKDFVIM